MSVCSEGAGSLVRERLGTLISREEAGPAGGNPLIVSNFRVLADRIPDPPSK